MGGGQRICLRCKVVYCGLVQRSAQGTLVLSRNRAVIEVRASDAGRIFTLHMELACKMRQAFYDNSSTKWKQSILAMLKQTPIRLPVGAATGRQCKGALPDVRNAGAGRGLDRRRRRD
jgi:hypothetical protein